MQRFVQLAAAFVIALPFAMPGAASAELKSGEFSPPRMAPDFTLQGSNGKPLRLADYQGKVVALGFGFTYCPAVCPTTLAQLAAVKQKLGAAAKDFQVVYVTVDPDRDTPARMKTYLAGFDSSFLGATGTAAQLAQVRQEYGISSVRIDGGSAANYGFNHSSFIYLIDRAGKLRALSPYGRAVDDVVHDVNALLGQ
jgi:protein SCO1/2